MPRRRSHWGWGFEDERPSTEELRSAAAFLSGHVGFGSTEPDSPVPLSEIAMGPPRLRAPERLGAICSSDRYERALHCYGRSYRDLVRAFRGEFEHPPDVVARPRDEQEVQALLEWAIDAEAAVIPFGGGTSVVGGVEAAVGDEFAGVVMIDLTALDRVPEVDRVSLAARIQAGARGPRLEQQLGADGLTLRHFPQSFELSTLGGWIATRAGGHFATLYTHVDDLVESVRALTPVGEWESRRLPGSGAGISPDYLRDTFVAMGVLSETSETAITWERFGDFNAEVSARATDAVREVCGAGSVTGRFTHVYPDGPAPYYTILAPVRRGAELEQWAAIKRAASDAVIAGGGTIIHHHAVGRDHRAWYDRQRPEPFAQALRAAKAAVDPAGALKPGVLIDPHV